MLSWCLCNFYRIIWTITTIPSPSTIFALPKLHKTIRFNQNKSLPSIVYMQYYLYFSILCCQSLLLIIASCCCCCCCDNIYIYIYFYLSIYIYTNIFQQQSNMIFSTENRIILATNIQQQYLRWFDFSFPCSQQ